MRLAVGAPYAANQAGHVRVYGFNGTAWNQVGSDIEYGPQNKNSGWSVSLNGTRLAVGAPYYSAATSTL